MSISFVVPTLNEQGNVTRIYALINKALDGSSCRWEVLFVDDNSTDNTQAEIKSLNSSKVKLIISPERRGLGAALSLGWRNSTHDFILFLDCDSGISSSDLRLLISSREAGCVVIGSRYLKKSAIYGASKIKVFLSKVLNRFAGFIININVADLSHSLRIFPNDYIEITEILTHPGYFWLQGLVFKDKGYGFKEIPITFYERNIGLTKNKTRHMLLSVIKSFTKIIIIRLKGK